MAFLLEMWWRHSAAADSLCADPIDLAVGGAARLACVTVAGGCGFSLMQAEASLERTVTIDV